VAVRSVLRRGITVFALCGLLVGVSIGSAWAQPDVEPVAADAPPPEAAPPPPAGFVESSPPATTTSPDEWTLTLSAKDESQLVVAPLTTALSSREYEVGGTFEGTLTGPDDGEAPEGTLEVGYEIGCGIDMSTSNGVTLAGSAGFTPGFGLTAVGPVPTVLTPVSGAITVALKPGLINTVPVTKKEFEGADPWVMISKFRIKIDGCVGESFIRSYAYLTRSTAVSDAIVAWYGVTKKV
jgi:hypothetical protein